MSTKTNILSQSEVEQMADELRACFSAYSNEAEAAGSAGIIFTWLGLIGGPAGVCVTAGLLSGALGIYFGSLQYTVYNALNEVENIEDFFQNNSEYDRVEFQITYISRTVDGTIYLIPTNFVPTKIHSTIGDGWIIM